MIDKDFAKFDKLINNEINTLQFIKNNTRVWEYFNKLATDANAIYFMYKDKRNSRSFEFESSIEALVGGVCRDVHFGVKIDKTNEFISYYLAIFEKDAQKRLCLRKFHFDYASKKVARRRPHPVFHLQYCGKLSPSLRNKFSDEHIKHMNPNLSEPRIPHMPTSLALLLNHILIEFSDDKIIKIIEDSKWRKHIKENEKMILYPYYKQCNWFINLPDNKKLLTTDYFYGQ